MTNKKRTYTDLHIPFIRTSEKMIRGDDITFYENNIVIKGQVYSYDSSHEEGSLSEHVTFDKKSQKAGIETLEVIMAPLTDSEEECEPSIELLPGHHLVRYSELLLSEKAFELSVSPLQDEWHRELIEEEAGENRRLKKATINIRYWVAILRAIGVLGFLDGAIKKLGSWIVSG